MSSRNSASSRKRRSTDRTAPVPDKSSDDESDPAPESTPKKKTSNSGKKAKASKSSKKSSKKASAKKASAKKTKVAREVEEDVEEDAEEELDPEDYMQRPGGGEQKLKAQDKTNRLKKSVFRTHYRVSTGGGRKKRVYWTSSEENALERGFAKHGRKWYSCS